MRSLLNWRPARATLNHYAWIDQQGICRALRQSRVQPSGQGWQAVSYSCPSWLGRPLPEAARQKAPQARPSTSLEWACTL